MLEYQSEEAGHHRNRTQKRNTHVSTHLGVMAVSAMAAAAAALPERAELTEDLRAVNIIYITS